MRFNTKRFNTNKFNSHGIDFILLALYFLKGFRNMTLIKVSESVANRRRLTFRAVSSSDYKTMVSGLTFSGSEILVLKNDGTQANFAGTVTDTGGGGYTYEPSLTEVNTLGLLSIKINKTGMLPEKVDAQIVSFDPYDAVRFGLTSLPSAAAGSNNGLPLGNASGQVSLNLTQDVPTSDISAKTTQNVGDCLSSARADAAGRWVLSGSTLTMYGPNDTIFRTFYLNDASNPTERKNTP